MSCAEREARGVHAGSLHGEHTGCEKVVYDQPCPGFGSARGLEGTAADVVYPWSMQIVIKSDQLGLVQWRICLKCSGDDWICVSTRRPQVLSPACGCLACQRDCGWGDVLMVAVSVALRHTELAAIGCVDSKDVNHVCVCGLLW